MYTDVREILDAALRSGGGEFTLATHGAAIHWRQRAYKFRKLFAETVAKDSPYDGLTLPQIPAESSTVLIKLRAQRGTFVPLGEPVAEPGDDDGLLDAALNLAKDLP